MADVRRRLLIVDGYNVLRSGSRYAAATVPDYTLEPLNQARERLVSDVITFAGTEYEAVVVFDATHNEHAHKQRDTTIGAVRVVFSKHGHTADQVIEKLAFDAKKRGIEVLVVSSDASIQDAVFGGGVDRMSAEGFCQELALGAQEAFDDKHPQVAYKSTVAERIAPDVYEQLQRMRDMA